MSRGSSSAPTLRAATAADVDAVAALERECLGADAWSPALVADGITGGLPTITYLVVERVVDQHARVVGYAVASTSGDVVELQRIAVAPAQRRGGLARMLLGAVRAQALAAGADRLLLEVRADNQPGLGLYGAEGFVEVHRRPRYYRDGASALVLQQELVRSGG